MTPTYAYTIAGADQVFISVDSTVSSQLNVMTNNPSHVKASAYSVTLAVTLTDTNSKAYAGGADVSFNKTGITIPLFISDPCATTTLEKVNADAGLAAFTVQDG